MPMYNLIEYSDNYSKASGSLWQQYRNKSASNNAGTPDNFPGSSALFKYKQKITGSTGNDVVKAVKIIVPLNYLISFRRTLERALITFETNLILTWSENCYI